MKKQALLLMAGGVLAFASCNTATNEGASDAQVDSMVNARVEEIRLEMMAQNDSLINAMALIKADSIIAAMKGGTVTTKTTTRTTVKSKGGTTVTASPGTSTSTTVEKGGLKSKSDNAKVNNSNAVEGGGLKSQSDKNRTNSANKTEGGGLKSQSDANRNK